MMAREIAKSISKKIRKEARDKDKKIITAARVRKMIANELQERNQQNIVLSYTGQRPENTQRDIAKVREESLIGSGDFDSVLHDRSKRLGASP